LSRENGASGLLGGLTAMINAMEPVAALSIASDERRFSPSVPAPK